MPRWESDARGRLESAALELFEAQGFDRTSIAQITRTAGLTERSFYRYFPDKREVLFAGDELEGHLVARLQAADPGSPPLEALLTVLGTADEVFRSREFLLRRATVIAANSALAERDLVKLAGITDALARVLRDRGIEDGTARFVIGVAIEISRRATSLWLLDPDATLADLVAQAASELHEALAPPTTTAR